MISESYVDDFICDCSDCEDESYWTCESCSFGCPDTCGDYTDCLASTFNCNDSCVIPKSYVDDSICDCSNCEDEYEWTCESCSSGCPDYCGNFTYCRNIDSYTYGSSSSYHHDGTYECDDGCKILESYVDDSYCDCANCEDESRWTCESCHERCPANHSCGDDWSYCINRETLSQSNSSYLCSDGCTISRQFVNDSYCDCGDCDDEPDWNCDTCAGGCPGGSGCAGYTVCDINVLGVVFYDFLLDCQVSSWQEIIVLVLETLVLMVNLFLVGHLIIQMKREYGDEGRDKMTQFTVLVIVCNVSYVFATILCIQKTYFVFVGWQWCNVSLSSRIFIDIGYIFWEKSIFFAAILVYIIFSLRFERSLNGSMFKSKQLQYYLLFTCLVLVSLWIWSIIASVLYYIPQWDGKIDDKKTVVSYEALENFTSNATNIMLGVYSLFSIIVLALFLLKFGQFLGLVADTKYYASGTTTGTTPDTTSCTSSTTGNTTGDTTCSAIPTTNHEATNCTKSRRQQQYTKYLSSVSRTALLSTIALTSTVVLIIVVTTIWTVVYSDSNYDPYIYEYIGIAYGIDSTINILCLNLNFKHGLKLYNRIGCNKLESGTSKCVLFCFHNCNKYKGKHLESAIHRKRASLELGTATGTPTTVNSNQNNLNKPRTDIGNKNEVGDVSVIPKKSATTMNSCHLVSHRKNKNLETLSQHANDTQYFTKNNDINIDKDCIDNTENNNHTPVLQNNISLVSMPHRKSTLTTAQSGTFALTVTSANGEHRFVTSVDDHLQFRVLVWFAILFSLSESFQYPSSTAMTMCSNMFAIFCVVCG